MIYLKRYLVAAVGAFLLSSFSAGDLSADEGLWFSVGPTLVEPTPLSGQSPPAGLSRGFVLPIFQQPEALAFQVSLTNSSPQTVAIGVWPAGLSVNVIDATKALVTSDREVVSQQLIREWATEAGEPVAWDRMEWAKLGRYLTYSGSDVLWEREVEGIEGISDVLHPGETLSAEFDLNLGLDLSEFEGWLQLEVKLPLPSGEVLSSSPYLIYTRPPQSPAELFEVERVRSKRMLHRESSAEAGEQVLRSFLETYPNCSVAWQQLTYHLREQEQWSEFSAAALEWRAFLINPASDVCAGSSIGGVYGSELTVEQFDQWVASSFPVPEAPVDMEVSCKDLECDFLVPAGDDEESWIRLSFGDGSDTVWTQDALTQHIFPREGTYLVRAVVLDSQLSRTSTGLDLEVEDFTFFFLTLGAD